MTPANRRMGDLVSFTAGPSIIPPCCRGVPAHSFTPITYLLLEHNLLSRHDTQAMCLSECQQCLNVQLLALLELIIPLQEADSSHNHGHGCTWPRVLLLLLRWLQ